MLDIFVKPDFIVEPWLDPIFEQRSIHVSVLRADLIHPWIQGNKWHKLQCYVQELLAENKMGFYSIGGPFSNHLIALAFAAHALKKKAHFYIRGGRAEWGQNPAVAQMESWGAELYEISRSDFRNADQFLALKSETELSNYVFVPLGGSGTKAVQFVENWANQIAQDLDFEFIALPIATAGTVSGFATSLPEGRKILAIEVLRSNGFLETDMNTLIQNAGKTILNSPTWINDYHFGGYAKTNAKLNAFCRNVFDTNGIPIEPIYSGKAFFAVSDLARKGYFQEGSRILIVHTGGIFPWNTAR